ncbi:MAG: hypothetical protein DSY37_00370 [Hyperthermus sp.]|nr:MAG: hypothetical protein DSY37_00370 [Hyperthermus sp.]
MKPGNTRSTLRLVSRAARIINQNRILYMKLYDNGVVKAVVRGDSGALYIVVLDTRTLNARCSCPHFKYNGTCKHTYALRLRYLSHLRRNIQLSKKDANSKPLRVLRTKKT